MNQENPVHVRLNYLESKDAKKSILSSEINLLELKKGLQNYRNLRIKELEKKEKLAQKIRSLKSEMGKLIKILPKMKAPLRKKQESQANEKVFQRKSNFSSLEQELNEIRLKLKKLEE